MFRQEGDMGRYVAFNDPGQPGAGFSSLEEYLAAGNQMPQLPNREPLKAANSGILDLPTLNDAFSNITAPGQIPDRYKEGFVEFYKQNPDDFMRMGGQAISYVTTPQGETIQFGDTGGASNFRRYLESIGETPRDDSLTFISKSTNPLAPDNNAFPASPGFTPLPTIPKPIASPGLPRQQGPLPLDNVEPLKTVEKDTQPFNRIGQQMINFEDMFGPLNTRLNKIEEGIASLLQNRGQGLNINTMPTRNLNNFFQEPIGTFPFRSFYG
jgi:hypothetical protein